MAIDWKIQQCENSASLPQGIRAVLQSPPGTRLIINFSWKKLFTNLLLLSHLTLSCLEVSFESSPSKIGAQESLSQALHREHLTYNRDLWRIHKSMREKVRMRETDRDVDCVFWTCAEFTEVNFSLLLKQLGKSCPASPKSSPFLSCQEPWWKGKKAVPDQAAQWKRTSRTFPSFKIPVLSLALYHGRWSLDMKSTWHFYDPRYWLGALGKCNWKSVESA